MRDHVHCSSGGVCTDSRATQSGACLPPLPPRHLDEEMLPVSVCVCARARMCVRAQLARTYDYNPMLYAKFYRIFSPPPPLTPVPWGVATPSLPPFPVFTESTAAHAIRWYRNIRKSSLILRPTVTLFQEFLQICPWKRPHVHQFTCARACVCVRVCVCMCVCEKRERERERERERSPACTQRRMGHTHTHTYARAHTYSACSQKYNENKE